MIDARFRFVVFSQAQYRAVYSEHYAIYCQPEEIVSCSCCSKVWCYLCWNVEGESVSLTIVEGDQL